MGKLVTEKASMSGASTHLNADVNIQFMVPGFSKCGTTTLCALLDAHPGICLSTNKEPNFFLRADYGQQWGSYKKLFPSNSRDLVCGEGSTFYSTSEHEKYCRDNILKHFPQIKMIFVARDPLKRIESSFREFHHSGTLYAVNAEFDIDRALTQFPQLIADSLFYARLSNYLQRIPSEQVLVLFLEDLVANTEAELRRCFNFLGVDPAPAASIGLRTMNAGEAKLYDAKLLRRLRVHPYWGWKIAKLEFERQNKIFKILGLRKPFSEQMQWSDQALETVARALTEDTQNFLRMNGKEMSFWPHFEKISRLYCRQVPNRKL